MDELNAKSSAFFQAIDERRREDPLIGAKLGAKEFVQRIMEGMKDEKGVHIESMLCAFGALAGYSCQAGVRQLLVHENGINEKEAFVIVDCADGRKYFAGETLNKPLVESQYSVWALAGGAAQHLGAENLIDIGEIFKYVIQTVGSEKFGILRISEDHKPGDLPCNYLKYLWPAIFPVVKQFCSAPVEWPILFGLAIQEVMYSGKDVIAPLQALMIVMESAVPMSKVDFNSL